MRPQGLKRLNYLGKKCSLMWKPVYATKKIIIKCDINCEIKYLGIVTLLDAIVRYELAILRTYQPPPNPKLDFITRNCKFISHNSERK